MAGSTEQPEAAVEAASTANAKDASDPAPTSPARSDKSSDSEGKPVRDKLKETRIDAQATSDPVPSSDQHMDDAPNGSAASGSDTDRGRLRRKRSREDFEDEAEGEKHPGKKQEKEERRHVRKRSRDVKDIESGAPLKPAATSVTTIQENDENMLSPSKDTLGTDASPKNKRTRDQVEEAATPVHDTAKGAVANGKPASKAEDERESKRLRDEDEAQPAASATQATATATAKIPPTSGFANTSAVSPFAAMSPKPQAPKGSEQTGSPPQTSNDKFQSSGFGSLTGAESPFGGLAKSEAKTGFGALGGNKLTGPGELIGSGGMKSKNSIAPATGFGALAGSAKSTFGGSTFGSSLGGGFGALASSKPATSAASTNPTINGLESETYAFGSREDRTAKTADAEDGDDDDAENDSTEKERQSSQPLLSQQPHETGEEGETTAWTGRAKLYTMSGEGSSKAWKERGVGTFKLNVTVDEPKKARFVLRADGTHRLLLNAAVTKQLVFGGDSNGEKPKDGRVLFNSPTADGELEMHLLKLKSERAVELWEEVSKIQETEL